MSSFWDTSERKKMFHECNYVTRRKRYNNSEIKNDGDFLVTMTTMDITGCH